MSLQQPSRTFAQDAARPVRQSANELALASNAPPRPRRLLVGRRATEEPPSMAWCAGVLDRRAPVFVGYEPELAEPSRRLLEQTHVGELRLGAHADARLLDQVHTARVRAICPAHVHASARAFLDAADVDLSNALELVQVLTPFARGGWLLIGRRAATVFGAANVPPSTWIRRGSRLVVAGSAAARVLAVDLQLAWLEVDELGRFAQRENDVVRVAAEHVVFDRKVGDFRNLVVQGP